MTVQYSVALRTAKQAAIETEVGATPIIEFWDGPLPADCAAAATGTLLAQFALPSDWLAAAAAGAVAKTGTWSGSAIGTGQLRYFRIYRAGSPSACDIQGTVGPTGSPTYDMTVDNTSVAPGQTITVSTFTLTAGNA